MRYLRLWGLLALILLATAQGVSQGSDQPVIVNLMIDALMPQMTSSTTTQEQAKEADSALNNIYNHINDRGQVGTIFAPQDVIRSNLDLPLTRIGLNSKFELAISGNNSNENISTMPYVEQLDSLKTSKRFVENCKVCGTNNITVYGFIPQSFQQNQDTYKVLDDLDIQYNAGFQAGLLYTPGHENDVWPYPVLGHKFYAVPVSTYDVNGKKIVLRDSYFKDNGLDANQWYEAMVTKFDQIQGKDEPLVISLTTPVSGSGEYLDALFSFLDYSMSKKATFVTTMQLVTLAKTGARDISSLLPENESGVCLTCGQEGVGYTMSIGANVTNPVQASNNTTGVAAH